MSRPEQQPRSPIGRLAAITLDVRDLDRCGEFWSSVLGAQIQGMGGKYLFLKRDDGLPGLALQRVPDHKVGKNRAHPDIRVEDVAAAVARVEALGGRKLQDHLDLGFRVAVMADPEGNEFCLFAPQMQRGRDIEVLPRKR